MLVDAEAEEDRGAGKVTAVLRALGAAALQPFLESRAAREAAAAAAPLLRLIGLGGGGGGGGGGAGGGEEDPAVGTGGAFGYNWGHFAASPSMAASPSTFRLPIDAAGRTSLGVHPAWGVEVSAHMRLLSARTFYYFITPTRQRYCA